MRRSLSVILNFKNRCRGPIGKITQSVIITELLVAIEVMKYCEEFKRS